MKKEIFFICLNLIALICVIATPFIYNIAALIVLGITIIIAFATRKKFGIGIVIVFIITLTTVLFRLSEVYQFNFAVRVSISYCFITQGVCLVISLMIFILNIIYRKHYN